MNLKKYFTLFILLLCGLKTLYAENVGIIYNKNVAVYKKIVEQFKASLALEGHLVHEVNYSKNIKDYTSHILDSGCTYFFAIGSGAAKACDKAGVPGVFTLVIDPVRQNLIDSDGMSLGLMTGVLVNISPHTQFSYLQKIMPNKKRGGIIFDPSVSKYLVSEYEKAAESAGISIYKLPVKSKEEVMPALKKLRGNADFILAVVDNTVYNLTSIQIILRFSLTNKIPLIGFSPQQVKAGALIAFYCNYPNLGSQCANLMLSLIESGDIATVLVEFPSDTNYVINLQTAKIMKLDIPDDIKNNANKVFGD